MPFGLQAFSEVAPVAQSTSFTITDTTAAKEIVAAANGPQRIDEILITSDDSADLVLNLFLRTASVNTLMYAVPVVAGTGTDGTGPQLAINFIATANLTGMTLVTGQSLQASLQSTMTAAKTLTVTSLGGTL